MAIIDNHGREVNYLRLAVTDRCNLRCFYCMPDVGINFAPKKELLSFEEMLRLSGILRELGITKVRITGGEPFLRKDLMFFLSDLASLGFEQISITTNGTLLMQHIDRLEALGIKNINFSLDTLDSQRFYHITRRDQFHEVWNALMLLLQRGFRLKINMVVMDGINDVDILPMARLAKEYPISMRFIEEMPFNGSTHYQGIKWTHKAILSVLMNEFNDVESLPFIPGGTAQTYRIKGFQGDVGIIAAYTRSFCGTCNRLRITPQGALKTCLYDHGVFNLKEFMRNGATDQQLVSAILDACSRRAVDGHEAESNRSLPLSGFESMATIGG